MKYSVVMPCLLREDQHRQVVVDTLESVRNNGEESEIIIVDDGSPLLSGFLRDYADTYIRHKVPQGIAPSWNDGIRVARGEYVVVINDDVLVPRGWLSVLSNVFSKQACGVSAPARGGFTVAPGILTGEPYIDEKFYPGYCFMLKQDRFFEKFDETFVPYNCEDTDYWWRLKQKNYQMYRAPMEIYHKEGDVIKGLGDYVGRSKEAVEQFIKKWGFDPQPVFYS